jgi:hypothetical protein
MNESCCDLPRHELGCGALEPSGLGFLYQRFSSPLRRSPSVPKPAKQNGGQVATIVLSETHGLWLFRVIREGLGSAVRLGARGTQRLTNQLRLALEPECLENSTATAREDSHDGADSGPRHSSCLWFQMIGVEAHPFLPHDQRNRGNLACQRKTCHLRPDAFGQQSRVELLERTRLAGGDDRRPLE